MTKVRGYVKPDASFRTLGEWEELCYYLLDLQGRGYDTRSGAASCKTSPCNIEDAENFLSLIAEYFNYQLTTEVDRWDLLTEKNVLDFIEDFVNHRVWSMDSAYGHYFPDFSRLRFAFFYSRGDLEPYILLNEEYTEQLYGSTYNPKTLCHYTTPEGVARIAEAIREGKQIDISSFTVMERPFFRKESNVLLTFVGNVRAGFRSDVKSYVVDSGRRACNMYRLEYPGKDVGNICYELETCDGSVRTSLWNEYIATPIELVSIEQR